MCIYYISIIKFLERVGDHACKIAEKINFMVTGMRAHIEWASGNDLRDLSRKFFTVSGHLTVYIATRPISGVLIVTGDLIGGFILTVSHDPDNLLIEYAWFTWDGTEYGFIVRGVDAYTLTETQMGPSIMILAYPTMPITSD